jgi:hypothetical protein
MPRPVTATVNGGGATMSTPAQITIAGVLSKEHIAALVDLAIEAGAALMVQPRALPVPASDVVEAAPRRPKALPPARQAKTRQVEPTAAALPLLPDRVLRALRAGPILAAEFRRVTGLSVYEAKRPGRIRPHRRHWRHERAPLCPAGPLGEGGALSSRPTASRSSLAKGSSKHAGDSSSASRQRSRCVSSPRRRRLSRGRCILSARLEVKRPSWRSIGTARSGAPARR